MGRKLTTNEFIEKAKLVHGDKYDYSKINYQGLSKKITIICPEHGEFEQSASNHLQGKGCPECGKLLKKNASRKKKTTEEFIKEAKEIHNNFYNYDKVIYTGRMNKVIITCPIHGDFEQTPAEHLHKHGCSKCKSDRAKETTDTLEEFIKKSKISHGNKYDYSKVNYINSQTKVCIICPEHGEFWQKPYSHIAGHGCSRCHADSMILSQEEFLKLAYSVHRNKYDYSKAKYINTKTPVCIICPEHGEFWQTPNVHLSNKSGCPKCSVSKGEELIINILNDYNIKYIYNYKIDIDKSINPYGYGLIDFYLPDYNIAIEYNGQQHYIPIDQFGGELTFKRQQKRDEFVRNYCKENNIKLIEIKYDRNRDQIINLVKDIMGL